MVQKYKRLTERQRWSEDEMRQAIEAVHNGLPYKTAARNFGVPLMSLKRRCKGSNKLAVNELKKLGSKTPVFTEAQEEELVAHILDMESRMYGLTTKDVRSIAYELAVKNNIKHPFSVRTKLAGKDWLTGFRKRHPELSLRSPEATSAARARAFNKPVVTKFFTLLKTVLDKTKFPPHRIFNVDETSVSTVPSKNSKVLAKKGRKQVGRVVSAERGASTTAVICMGAGGSYVPPMLIFSRKRMKEELKDGAPPGTVFACNDSGWMNLDVFSDWFNHFLSHVKPTADDPVLLILDGHLSHTKNLSVIEKARSNFVTILCLPPHTTHRLQPLDLSFMYPFGHYHDDELEKWLTNHPGRVVTVFQISRILSESYIKASTPANAISGFRKAGIVPYNPDIFSDVDFAASEVTEQEEIENVPQVEETYDLSNNTAAPSTPAKQVIRPANLASTSSPLRPRGEVNKYEGTAIPSTSGVSSSFRILPNDVRPLPKMSSKQRSTKARKSVGSVVLTSTPYKNQLEEERQKKEEEQERKALRAQKRTEEKGNQKQKNKRPRIKNAKVTQTRKQDESGEETDVEEDVECLLCTETFFESVEGEGWVQCVSCQRWAHEQCAGIDENDCDPYSCDNCLENVRISSVRRRIC